MKYTSNFYSLSNTQYTVEIITGNNANQSLEIDLQSTPFTVSMEACDENIYEPVRYSNGTVNIVNNGVTDYKFDLYSPTAQGTKVTLKSGNTVVWVGYSTPILYDNGYKGDSDTISLECIDGLGTLQYYKYESANKSIISLLSVLYKCINACNCYTYLYVSKALRYSSSDTAELLKRLWIAESCFFEEKEDSDETDNDVAWNLQDVLTEVCRYLNLCAVAYGDSVYLLDYDAIGKKQNTYWRYTLSNINSTPSSVTLSHKMTLAANMYQGSDNSISLDKVYNKVSVSADMYTFDSVLPDFYDYAENITKSSDPDLSSSVNVNEGMYGEIVSSTIGNADKDKTNNNNMIVLLDRVYDPEEEEYTDYYAIFVKYFNNPYYKFYKYNGSSRSEVTSLNYTDTKTYHGAFIAKFGVKKLDKTFSWMEQWIRKIYNREITLDEWLSKNEISSVSFDDYIVLLNPTSDGRHISNDNITSYPYFETSLSDSTALFGGQNAYLVISGSYFFHYMDNDPYPISEGVDISEGRYAMDAGQTYLLAKLQWGNKYWNGSSWTTSSATFQIPYLKEDASSGDRRADACMFKNLNFVNTVSWRIGTSEKGYLIPLPQGEIIGGLPKITVYKPFDPNYHSSKSGSNEGQHYKHSCVFLKKFEMKAIVGDPTYSDVNETDTEYTNVINSGYTEEAEEIEFKVNTYDYKKPNYSSVAYSTDGSNFIYVDKLYNTALASGESSWTGSDNVGTGGYLRQEEHLIYRLVNQYSNPAIRLKLCLNNVLTPYSLVTESLLSNKKFIVDCQTIDYQKDKTDVELREIK